MTRYPWRAFVAGQLVVKRSLFPMLVSVAIRSSATPTNSYLQLLCKLQTVVNLLVIQGWPNSIMPFMK